MTDLIRVTDPLIQRDDRPSRRGVTLHLVVMGVSGCGKSTAAALLADHWGLPLLEGDDLHPKSNVDRMAAGIPLDDAARRPWLIAINQRIRRRAVEQTDSVISCSALRASYRELLRAGVPGRVAFVHLNPPEELLRERLEKREGHFMGAGLLESQLTTLERLRPEEDGLTLTEQHADGSSLIARVRDWLGRDWAPDR